MIELEHLQALRAETEDIIAQAAAAGSSSTVAAYDAQLQTITKFIDRPAAVLEAAAGPDAPTETIVIQGFDFDGCAAPGCLNLTPCPVHQHHAWQEQVNKLWNKRGHA